MVHFCCKKVINLVHLHIQYIFSGETVMSSSSSVQFLYNAVNAGDQ